MVLLDGLRRVVLQVAAMAQRDERVRVVRRALATLAGFLRNVPEAPRRIRQFRAVVAGADGEQASWVGPESLAEGTGGPFDACDLRHWLAVAERAGVPSVPAREILALDQGDMEFLSGIAELPEGPVLRGIRRRLDADPDLRELVGGGTSHADGTGTEDPATRQRRLELRLMEAMDAVPEGWMVRSARCGSTELKSLAGSGAIGREPPEVRFGPDLEVGPGWVRQGNRRRVWVRDTRTVRMAAEAPPGPIRFLARPWVEADRYAVGEDPHRHGTPFAGKGVWPAEWRAFVEDGEVVGVSWYYGWCGRASPEDARIALAVRGLARKIVASCVGMGAWPRDMRLEWARAGERADDPALAPTFARFPREGVSCTLDFVEARGGGPMLLEGGPPNMPLPFGGGHPVAFAGCGGVPAIGTKTETVGVAFTTLPGVLLADPATWSDGDREGRILPWAEVESLAAT